MSLDFSAYVCVGQQKIKLMNVYLFLIFFGFSIISCTTPVQHPLHEDPTFAEKNLILIERAEKEQAILEESGFVYEEKGLQSYLNDVVKRLHATTLQSQPPPRVKVIKDPHLDAFVFPNGVIYIQTGILARLENEAQLALILAHEIIHYTHQHAFKNLGWFETQQTGQESGGLLKDLLNRLGATVPMAVMAGYSQTLETEADLGGMALVSAAGYDTREALRFFDHLKREVETEEIKEPLFFGIHPRIEKRIDNCENFLFSHPEADKKGLMNQDLFLEKTREVVLVNAFLDLKAGRYESARRGAEKYLELNQKDARVYYLMGELVKVKGDAVARSKMMGFYEKAIALDPIFPEPYRAIGLLHYKDEKWGLAEKAFMSYLALSTHNQDRAYILEYLEKCRTEGV